MSLDLLKYDDLKYRRILNVSSGSIAASGNFQFTYNTPPDYLAYLAFLRLTRTAGTGTYKVLAADFSVDDETIPYSDYTLQTGTLFGPTWTDQYAISVIPMRQGLRLKVIEDGGIAAVTVQCISSAYVRKLGAKTRVPVFTRRR